MRNGPFVTLWLVYYLPRVMILDWIDGRKKKEAFVESLGWKMNWEYRKWFLINSWIIRWTKHTTSNSWKEKRKEKWAYKSKLGQLWRDHNAILHYENKSRKINKVRIPLGNSTPDFIWKFRNKTWRCKYY